MVTTRGLGTQPLGTSTFGTGTRDVTVTVGPMRSRTLTAKPLER